MKYSKGFVLFLLFAVVVATAAFADQSQGDEKKAPKQRGGDLGFPGGHSSGGGKGGGGHGGGDGGVDPTPTTAHSSGGGRNVLRRAPKTGPSTSTGQPGRGGGTPPHTTTGKPSGGGGGARGKN